MAADLTKVKRHILTILADGEMKSGDLRAKLNLAIEKAISNDHFFRSMRELGGQVVSRKQNNAQGRFTYYSLAQIETGPVESARKGTLRPKAAGRRSLDVPARRFRPL